MLPLPLPSVDSVPHFVYSGFFLSAFRYLSHLILKSPPIYPGPPLTCGFWIPLSAFLFPPLWILDSGFQSLDFIGFSSPKPRIPLAKTTWIPESGLPFLGRNNLVIIDFFFLLLLYRRLFSLHYNDSNTTVFGWTLATKAFLYYNIFTVHLYYILSNVLWMSYCI